jgi:hypothetical protein
MDRVAGGLIDGTIFIIQFSLLSGGESAHIDRLFCVFVVNVGGISLTISFQKWLVRYLLSFEI